MMAEIKRMDIKEFVELGLLQEVNRQFFHPRGLALEVEIDDETDEHSLGGVWDCRNDPEGIWFEPGVLDAGKCLSATSLILDKSGERVRKLGFIIQPIYEDDEK